MPDILGGSYYGTEHVVETAPGGVYDQFIGYETYAPDDGYLVTSVSPFDAFYETVEWGGSSDPYQSPRVSTSDIIRSHDAGIPYPASPIYTVAPTVSSDSERSTFDKMFRGVVDIFGKAAVTLAGTVGAQALERAIPGRPSSSDTRMASGTGYTIPPKPFVLPTFLGGGSFSPTSGNMLMLIIAGLAGVFVLAAIMRR